MRLSLESTLIINTAPIREAIACIEHGGCGIAVVGDGERHFIGTVTDGDVRRAMLAALDLDTPGSTLLTRKGRTQYSQPVTASARRRREEVVSVISQNVL